MENLKIAYDKWHKGVGATESNYGLQLCQWHKEAFATFFDINQKSILEVGCGRGDFSLFLAEKGAKVHGTDFSDSAIDIAKAKLKGGGEVEFSVVDAQQMPFQDETFDVIYSCECLEHIPNPELALQEMFRTLKKGGIAVVTTENYSNGMYLLWLKSWITRKPFNSGSEIQPIENFFLYWKVKRMMEKSGFEVKKITGWHYVFFILPGNINWIKESIKNSALKRILKPFARHMTFLLEKKY